MLLLVSGATRTVRELAPSGRLGVLVSPRSGNSLDVVEATGLPWAADNDAFSAWCPLRYRRMLDRLAGRPRLLWVAAPDVVGDAAATLELYYAWRPLLRGLGLPIAYVAQDGAGRLPIPEDARCLFLGGTTEFKLGPEARDLAAEARRLGLRVHMGRVNSLSRLRLAHEFGCDSVDGTGFSRFARAKLPPVLERLDYWS